MQGEFWVIRTDEQKAAALGHLACIRPDPSAPVAIKVEPYKRRRSDLQNRFLWGWIYAELERQLADAGIVIHCDDGTGHPYTKDVLHEIFKTKFLAIGSIEAKGRSLTLYKSTTQLNTQEFSEFVENVRRFAYQFWGITVHDPVDKYYRTILEEIRGRAVNP